MPMAITCEKVEQITVLLDNRPGILADLCAHLADQKINIRAMTTLESPQPGARLVVSNPTAVKQTLAEAGVTFTTTACLAFEMPNHPGGLAHIARVLALAGINIDFIYASSTSSSAVALGIFGVSNPERAVGLDWKW
jgi:hypothetical protein